MSSGPDRRRFLQIALGTAAGLSCGGVAFGQRAGSPGPSGPGGRAEGLHVTPLGDTVRLVSGAGGNVVVFRGADGLVLVNGGAAAQSADLLAAIAQGTGGARVTTLFNTDWHPDHSGSNAALRTAGAAVIAHEHTKQYQAIERFVEWQNRTFDPLPPAALPTQTFLTTGTLAAGSERIDYGHLGQAHTDGDIYVFFRNANVLVAGDVLTVGRYPIADYTSGGWLGGLTAATKTLLDLTNAETKIVPGAGPVQTRADVEAQHQMLQAARERLVKMMRSGMGAREMVAAGATKEFDARWGSPDLFVATAYRGLWLHVRELGGIV